MLLSNASVYAVRALLLLARHAGDRFVSAGAVAAAGKRLDGRLQ